MGKVVRAKRSESERFQMVDAYLRSGQSAEEFAQDNGIRPSTLASWLKQVAKKAPSGLREQRFVEVLGPANAVGAPVHAGGMEIILDRGITLRFGSLPSPAYVLSLARALSGRGRC